VVNQSPVVFVFQCLAACCLPNRNISITQFFLFKNLPGKRFIKEQYYTTRNANYAPMENERDDLFRRKIRERLHDREEETTNNLACINETMTP
jgi:hypothetical protein